MDNKQIYITVVLEKFTLFVNLTSFLFVFRLRYLFLQVQYIATWLISHLQQQIEMVSICWQLTSSAMNKRWTADILYTTQNFPCSNGFHNSLVKLCRIFVNQIKTRRTHHKCIQKDRRSSWEAKRSLKPVDCTWDNSTWSATAYGYTVLSYEHVPSIPGLLLIQNDH